VVVPQPPLGPVHQPNLAPTGLPPGPSAQARDAPRAELPAAPRAYRPSSAAARLPRALTSSNATTAPNCQSLARACWLQARRRELLPVTYFHVVFTVPPEIATIGFQNAAQFYTLLFRGASQILLTIAADPKHLGAQISFWMILHTRGTNLLYHPHVHCVVPGGDISPHPAALGPQSSALSIATW
jgi:hypothetical protein